MFTSGFFEPAPVTIARRGSLRAWALFGPEHLAWLAVSTLLCLVLVRLYQRLPAGSSRGSQRHRMQLVVAAFPLALLASQDLGMIATGTFTPSWWPLHSCNLCELLCLVYVLLPTQSVKHETHELIGEVLFTLGLTGAAFALLFPGWYYCDAWSWPSLCGFAEHSLIIAFVVMLLVGRDLQPQLKNLQRATLFSFTCAVGARMLNAHLGTNFFFVSVAMPGSPLAAFERLLGNPGYLVPYALVLVALWRGEHALWEHFCK